MKDKQNLPQLIVLGVLVLFCLGYVVMKVAAKKPAPPVTQAKAEKTEAASTSASGDQTDAAAPVDETNIVTIPACNPAVGQVRRDPFSPTMDVSPNPVQSTPSYRNKSTMMAMRPAPIRPLVGLNFGDRLPQPTPVGAGASRTAGSAPVEQPKPAQDPLPQFVVTGIITGRTNVAIIRLGEGRYIAKEGQLINGIYKVVSVSQDGVLLSHDGRAFFLKLGGEGNAS